MMQRILAAIIAATVAACVDTCPIETTDAGLEPVQEQSYPIVCPYTVSADLPAKGGFSASSYVTLSSVAENRDLCVYRAPTWARARTVKQLPVGAACSVSSFSGGVWCSGPFGSTMHRCPIQVPLNRPAFVQTYNIVPTPWWYVFRMPTYSGAVYGVYGTVGRQTMTCDYQISTAETWLYKWAAPAI